MTDIHPIHNEVDYKRALQRIEALMEAEEGTQEADELEVLSTLVSYFEDKNYPIISPDPIEAIRFRMEQMAINPKELGEMTETRPNRIYEILNRSRPLTLKMIRKLSESLEISPAVLIKDYPLNLIASSYKKVANHKENRKI